MVWYGTFKTSGVLCYMDQKTEETCSMVKQVYVSVFFRINRHWVLRAKDEKDHPDWFQ